MMTIVGARPQFVKAAAISRALAEARRTGECGIEETIVHTGQHYDRNLSDIFFEQLKIPQPEMNLGVGSGSHGAQTGEMLTSLEAAMIERKPDWVLIYGDTNSTLAGALAAVKLHIPVAHVEAGLRSFNRRMPEEINRVVADHVSKLLLCPTTMAVANLAAEGVCDGVHNVGDVMYDSVLFNRQLAEHDSDVLDRLGLAPGEFALATVHRAENTDDPARLAGICAGLRTVPVPVILPLHPRTRKTLGAAIEKETSGIRIVEPVAYLDMLMLEQHATMILTDSGGVQKEAYFFSTPCITLRDETEWVELVEAGANRLVGSDAAAIGEAVSWAGSVDLSAAKAAALYGDGHAAEQIVKTLSTA